MHCQLHAMRLDSKMKRLNIALPSAGLWAKTALTTSTSKFKCIFIQHSGL
jgi:hypothetical protein